MATLTLSWMLHPPAEFVGGAVTVGNFDGVHVGHRELVSVANRWAARVGGKTVAVTFDPPPVALLNPAAMKLPLSTLGDRIKWLTNAGADHVLVLNTDAGLLSLSPEAFFEDVLVGLLESRAIIEGYNFRFGRARSGDTNTLHTLCTQANIAFEEVPPKIVAGETVSSSRVRSALVAGNVALVSELLGRPYSIRGTVIPGAKRGRTIGFPTANLTNIETLLPKEGVYAVRVLLNGQPYPAAANIGPNPTFGESAQKVEVHVIGFTGDLYGTTMTVDFMARLRDTRPFANVGELVEQLKHDVICAEQISND